jgi:glutamate 5-kinase
LFQVGDVVSILAAEGGEFARGLVNYSAEEVERIKGRKSSEIEQVLGYKHSDEVIHRDNLVILEGAK